MQLTEAFFVSLTFCISLWRKKYFFSLKFCLLSNYSANTVLFQTTLSPLKSMKLNKHPRYVLEDWLYWLSYQILQHWYDDLILSGSIFFGFHLKSSLPLIEVSNSSLWLCSYSLCVLSSMFYALHVFFYDCYSSNWIV